MSKKPDLISVAIALRHRAEAWLRDQHSPDGNHKAATDILWMVHELEVLKIELEMQALELQETRDGLALALEEQNQLYDFSPVGYVSTNESGDIMGLNLAGASLLGVEPFRWINRRLELLMPPSSWPSFTAFLKKAFAGCNDQTCETLLLKNGGGTFWANFRIAPGIPFRGHRKRCLFTFRDITAHKLAARLTSREMEVLRLIVAGRPNKHIAAELDISQRTVEKHRVNLMQKLKVHDIAGLTRYAISAGIIEVTHG